MYAIVTKWTPLAAQVKYLNFEQLENILFHNNIDPTSSAPYIAPDLFDREIYADYFSSVIAYKTFFEAKATPVLFYSTRTNTTTAEVISMQVFASKDTHDSIIGSPEHDKLLETRLAFCNKAAITCEIRKKELTDLDISTIPEDFEGLEAIFNSMQ
jgi:hypothetical protein